MGGAVAVHLAYRSLIPLLGLVVIDVVEGLQKPIITHIIHHIMSIIFNEAYFSTGTALDALQSMQSFLRGRPASFGSIENAIEWW